MLIENKNAVIYGAGTIGGAVARAFVRESRGSCSPVAVWRRSTAG
jgi:predicted dinucleotide-binding enzyme